MRHYTVDKYHTQYINGFSGPHEFLSNFYHSPFVVDGKSYDTIEHYFQAMKSEDPEIQESIRTASSPGIAKRLGRQCELRENWECCKEDVMYTALAAKFTYNEDLATKLIDTGQAFLIEGNDWNDRYWGVPYGGYGKNRLGELLMHLREQINI